jgi:large subunit ribosomal protein L4
METTVYNIQGKESGKVNLPEVFSTKVSKDLLHEIVVGYMANRRSGTADTKSRGEVSGGGRKPWMEKGTGNARAGSNRSPLWRKGGIIFGPEPRSYFQRMSQQKRRLALQMALASKMQENNVVVLNSVAVDAPKTKQVSGILKNLKLDGKTVLLVVDKVDAKVKQASRNIPGLVMSDVRSLNAYQVLWANKLVLSTAAVDLLGK